MSIVKKLPSVYRQDESGGFAIMFGVCATVVILGVACALDYSRLAKTQAQLTYMADAAALAGANVAEIGLTDAQRNQIVLDMLTSNGHSSDRPIVMGVPTITFDDESREVQVNLNASVDLWFMGIIGSENLSVASTTVAAYQDLEVDPISISFALDVSGSMADVTSDGRTKIEVLKTATKGLFDAIEEGLPKKGSNSAENKIRTGMTAYNTDIVEEYSMSNGWTGLESDIDSLIANGGTNSTPALQNSYDQLKNDTVQPDNLRQFVIFMTDGDNNQPVWDEESAAICNDMRNDGIEIFSVAFDAPEKGQYLLVDCASPNGNGNNGNGNGNGNGNNGNGNGNGNGNAGPGNNNGNGNGNAYAYGHYKDKKDLEDKKKDKSEHYFDADDAVAFEAAFESIGKEIGELNIKIKS